MAAMKSRICCLLLGLVLAGTGCLLNAAQMGVSLTEDPTWVINNSDWMLGYSFVVNSPITVVSLGIWDFQSDGLAAPHDVGFWNSSGTLLASATVPAGSAGMLNSGFRFAPISPLVLTVGATYFVAAEVTVAAGDTWTVDPLVFNVAPEITYDSRRYQGYVGTLLFPNLVGSNSIGYFGGNFEFVPSAVPEPGTFTLLALGGLALAGFRRFRR